MKTGRAEADERKRLLVALAEIASAEPHRPVSEREVCERAGLEPCAFERHFATVGDSLVEAFESFGAEAIARADGGCAPGAGWAVAVHAALGRLLRHFDAEPALTRLCLAEVAPQQPGTARVHERTVGALAAMLARHAPALGRTSPQVTAEIVAGGVLTVLRQAVDANPAARLEELLPEVSFVVLAPFVGSREAERVAAA